MDNPSEACWVALLRNDSTRPRLGRIFEEEILEMKNTMDANIAFCTVLLK